MIASRFPLTWEGARAFAAELYDGLLRELASLEEAFLAARSKLSRRGTYDWASLQLYAREADGDATYVFNARPYRGLGAFAPEHARFFFGRDAEVDELVHDLDALVEKGLPRFLVVAGASGTGKSSMVMAGAVPRMARAAPDGRFGHVVVRPGATPDEALQQVADKREIADKCLRYLVVVDQFEELFTHVDLARATAFTRALWERATRPDSAVCVVVTVRVDFLGRLGEILLEEGSGLRLDKVACDPAHQVLVAQMGPDQLRDAIERPARAAGLALEPNLAELIVRDVGAEPGSLPLMSHTLELLWLGRAGAVDELRPEGARARERFEHVLERLVSARLLVTGGGAGGAQTVEIAHEALIHNWASFRGWVDAERVKLAQFEQLDEWVKGWRERPDALLRGSQLGYADEVAKEHRGELGADARRLTARGYGEIMPVESNDTSAGRQANRRVAFQILSQAQARATRSLLREVPPRPHPPPKPPPPPARSCRMTTLNQTRR